MTFELDAVLEKLHTDKTRLIFLEGAYSKGNAEATDRMLEIAARQDKYKYKDVLEEATEYARLNKNQERFRMLAKKLIDWHIADEQGTLPWLDTARGWKDEEIAGYGLAQVEANCSHEKAPVCELIFRLDLARAFNKTEIETTIKNELRKRTEDPDFEKEHWAIHAALRLEDYNLAITLYPKSHLSDGIRNALDLAEKHNPDRLKELAEMCFNEAGVSLYSDKLTPEYVRDEAEAGRFIDNSKRLHEVTDKDLSEFRIRLWNEVAYAKSAKILGREEEARKWLQRNLDDLEIKMYGPAYYNTVWALLEIDLKDQARDLVYKLDDMFRTERDFLHKLGHVGAKEEPSNIKLEELPTLYGLLIEYEALDKPEKAREACKYAAIQLLEGWRDITAANKIIDNYIELTEDKSILEARLVVYELTREYLKAAELAEEISKPELAEAYRKMQEMCGAGQTKTSETFP